MKKTKRRKRKTGIRPLLASAALLAAASALFAGQGLGTQQPPVAGPKGVQQTRTIEGHVLDLKGQPVPNATVLMKDTRTLQVRSYIADAQGRYHFFGLSTDVNFELRAQANGLSSKRKTVSVFDSHKTVKLDLKLRTKKVKQ